MLKLDDLFNARRVAIDYTDGQKQALNKVFKFLQSGENFFLLAGYSGCGKTTIAENIANATGACLLAPTNAAVNRLKEKIGNGRLSFSTIHAALFTAGDKKNQFFVDKTLKIEGTYIVDECSMIDKYVLDVLIKQAIEKKCKIIFMGDSFQLEPVGENPHIFEWEKSYPMFFLPYNKYELTEVKRYDGSLLKIATEIRTNKKATFVQPENSDLLPVKKFSKNLAKDINNRNNYVVLTSTNQKRMQYNEKIRSYLFRDGDVDMYAKEDDILVAVSNSDNYSNGEIFTIKNHKLLFEFELLVETKKGNHKSYTCLLYKHQSQLTLLIPELLEASLHGQEICNSVRDGINHLEDKLFNILITLVVNKKQQEFWFFNKGVTIATYGYAISCHKAQGQEWDNVYVDGSWLMPVWDSAKWFYTAITRAKNKVEVIQTHNLKIL